MDRSLYEQSVLVKNGSSYVMRDTDVIYGIISTDDSDWGEIGPIFSRMIPAGGVQSRCALIPSMMGNNIEIYKLSQQGKEYMKQCILSGKYEIEYHSVQDAIQILEQSK